MIAVAVLLGSVSLYLNLDWFRSDNIRISYRFRPARFVFFGRKPPGDFARNLLIFMIDRKLKFTDVRVTPLDILRTNKYAQPVWHLVSESNSVPIKYFAYGMDIKGMHPDIKGAVADPLVMGIPYRMELDLGKKKIDYDFTPGQTPQ